MVFCTVTLCARSAAIAVCRAKSTLPARAPKSSTRYERPIDGPYCERCDSTPLGASGCACVAFTLTVIVGKNDPRLAPNTSAAARACAHESRVAGLLRSARSTTSDTVSLPLAGTAPAAAGAARSNRPATDAGGVQYSLGCAGAPGPPEIDGG